MHAESEYKYIYIYVHVCIFNTPTTNCKIKNSLETKSSVGRYYCEWSDGLLEDLA